MEEGAVEGNGGLAGCGVEADDFHDSIVPEAPILEIQADVDDPCARAAALASSREAEPRSPEEIVACALLPAPISRDQQSVDRVWPLSPSAGG